MSTLSFLALQAFLSTPTNNLKVIIKFNLIGVICQVVKRGLKFKNMGYVDTGGKNKTVR